MKQFRLPIFNSQIKYYNLRIVPPEPVFESIVTTKKQFESLYGKQPLSKSKPHITLASFKMNQKNQDFLIQVFDQLSLKKKFKLGIGGFDIFISSNTLYLRVSKNSDIEELHKTVKKLAEEHLNKKIKSFIVSENPHLTISKTTGKRMLSDSLVYFQENDFLEKIEVNHLTLVSRSKYKSWDWEHKIKLS